MTFNDLMSTACGTIATAMGETVTHTAADDTETTIADAAFAERGPETAEVRDGKQTISRAACTIARAHVAAPAIGDLVTRALDSSEWAVETRPLAAGGGDYWQLALMRAVEIEKTRPGMRLARP